MRRRDYAADKELSRLLEEIPRATSAPPHLTDRWAVVSVKLLDLKRIGSGPFSVAEHCRLIPGDGLVLKTAHLPNSCCNSPRRDQQELDIR